MDRWTFQLPLLYMHIWSFGMNYVFFLLILLEHKSFIKEGRTQKNTPTPKTYIYNMEHFFTKTLLWWSDFGAIKVWFLHYLNFWLVIDRTLISAEPNWNICSKFLLNVRFSSVFAERAQDLVDHYFPFFLSINYPYKKIIFNPILVKTIFFLLIDFFSGL